MTTTQNKTTCEYDGCRNEVPWTNWTCCFRHHRGYAEEAVLSQIDGFAPIEQREILAAALQRVAG